MTSATDLDPFLSEPGAYEDSSNYSILSTGLETIDAPGALAGTYYFIVDSDTAANAGAHTLSISAIPEPTALGLIAAMAILPGRRCR